MKISTKLEYDVAQTSRALFLGAIEEMEERIGQPGVTDNEIDLIARERDACREKADELLRAMIAWERKTQ